MPLDDVDLSALGFIDERPLQNIGGVGISLDTKKVPFFVNWFDNVNSSIGLLEIFLKPQRSVWPAVEELIEHLEQQKKILEDWKERFEREVIDKSVGGSGREQIRRNEDASPPPTSSQEQHLAGLLLDLPQEPLRNEAKKRGE
jgi:hypothetical protein